MSIDRYKNILDTVASINQLKNQLRKERAKLESTVTVSEAKEKGPSVDVEQFKAAGNILDLVVEDRAGRNPPCLVVREDGIGLYVIGRKEEIIGLLYKESMKND